MSAPQNGRIGGLRTLRIVVLLIGLGVVANSVANVLLWQSNAARVDQINSERARNTFRACVETNARHDAAVAELDRLVAEMPPGPRQERARRSRDGTVALINALVPQRNCRALVARQIDTK